MWFSMSGVRSVQTCVYKFYKKKNLVANIRKKTENRSRLLRSQQLAGEREKKTCMFIIIFCCLQRQSVMHLYITQAVCYISFSTRSLFQSLFLISFTSKPLLTPSIALHRTGCCNDDETTSVPVPVHWAIRTQRQTCCCVH